MIAIIGTSDRPCWLAEACKILLLLLLGWQKLVKSRLKLVVVCVNPSTAWFM